MADDPTLDLTAGGVTGASGDRAPGSRRASGRAPSKRPARKSTAAKTLPSPRDASNKAKADIPKTTGRPPASAQRVQQLTQLLALTAVAVMLFDEYDGLVIIEHAAKVADSLNTVAESTPSIAKALDSAVAGSAWGAVVMSVLPIVVAILANHGVLPEGLRSVGGVPIPDEPAAPEPAAHTASPAPGMAGVAQMFAGAQAA